MVVEPFEGGELGGGRQNKTFGNDVLVGKLCCVRAERRR